MKEELVGFKINLLKRMWLFIDDKSLWLQALIVITMAVLTIFIFFIFSKIVSRNKSWFYRFTKTELLADLIAQSLAFFIKIIGIVVALYIVGAQSIVGFVLGTAGVLGLGISFAFKDIIENYIAGILLSIRQPFKKGDHILVSTHEGVVQRMTTRMTMIKSFSGNNISIPNATIFKSSITNYSVIPERRFEFNIGINPDADANFARKVGLNILKDLEGVLKDPPPLALIDSIGDSSIILTFYAWVNQNEFDFHQVRSLSISAVKERIEDAGVEIPDPSFIIKLKNSSNEVLKEARKAVQKPEKTKPELKQLEQKVEDVDYLISPRSKQSEVAENQIKKEAMDDGLLTNQATE